MTHEELLTQQRQRKQAEQARLAVRIAEERAIRDAVLGVQDRRPVPRTPLIEQQLQWLSDAYVDLMPIAMGITQNPIKAEDAISAGIESALMQVLAGECKAAQLAQFIAWVHQIVRFRCYRRLTQGSHDLPTDMGAKYLRKEARTDRRSSAFTPTDDDAWQHDCYVRDESAEHDDDHEDA